MIVIPAEAGTVAGDLQRMDRGLKLRFNKRPGQECWVVYHEHHDDCPHNGDGGPGSTYLVLSARAYQGNLGTWSGADQRLIKRLEEINPFGRNGYDFVAELEKKKTEGQKRAREEFYEKTGPIGELAAAAVRKDLGLKNRAFFAKRD